MAKKIVIFAAVLFTAFSLSVNSVHAKRRLPRATKIVTKTVSTPTTTTPTPSRAKGISSSVRFRSDRNAIIVTMSNLSVAQSVEYSLSYNVNGVTQGVNGSLSNLNEDPTTRELLFGTCSAGICTYESGIKDARFTITTATKNGVKVIKPYRLKV